MEGWFAHDKTTACHHVSYVQTFLRLQTCAAAGDGRLGHVKWLLEQGGADINRGNHDGRTPLHFACKAGHLEVFEQHLKSEQVKGLCTADNLEHCKSADFLDIANFVLRHDLIPFCSALLIRASHTHAERWRFWTLVLF